MTFQSVDMRGLRTRRLHYALAASLLFHLLLLWPSPARLPSREGSTALQATMRPAPSPTDSAAPAPKPNHGARPQTGLPDTAPSPTRIAATEEKPVTTKTVESAATVSVPQTAVTSAEAARSLPGSLPPAAPAAPGRAVVPGASVLTQAAAAGEAADGLRGYRLAVASQARRFKRYPAQAMASGWTGTAELRLEVGADGQPQPATVLRSSGHELLDRAALAMIDAGALRAPLPESLRGRRFVVLLPVVFNLDEE